MMVPSLPGLEDCLQTNRASGGSGLISCFTPPSLPPSLQEYIQCTQVWMEYVAKHFTVSHMTCHMITNSPSGTSQKWEVHTLLDDVIKHMTPGRSFEKHYPELVSIINRILAHMTDFHILFSMVTPPPLPWKCLLVVVVTCMLLPQDKFLPFMDLLQKDTVKVEVCQNVVKSFIMLAARDVM